MKKELFRYYSAVTEREMSAVVITGGDDLFSDITSFLFLFSIRAKEKRISHEKSYQILPL